MQNQHPAVRAPIPVEAVVISCPSCHQQLQVGSQFIGHCVQCPSCRASVATGQPVTPINVHPIPATSKPTRRRHRDFGVWIAITATAIFALVLTGGIYWSGLLAGSNAQQRKDERSQAKGQDNNNAPASDRATSAPVDDPPVEKSGDGSLFKQKVEQTTTFLSSFSGQTPVMAFSPTGKAPVASDLPVSFFVPDGTRCVEDKAYVGTENAIRDNFAKVVIRSGDYSGKTGWVSREHLRQSTKTASDAVPISSQRNLLATIKQGEAEHDSDVNLDEQGRIVFLKKRGPPISEEKMAAIGKLTSLKVLHLRQDGVRDEWVGYLKDLTELEELYLNENKLTSACMKHLARLPNLRILEIYDNAIDDSGIDELKAFPVLAKLDLSGTDVSDKCVPNLLACKSLQKVSIVDTLVSEGGYRKLCDARPSLDVTFSSFNGRDSRLKWHRVR